MKQNKIFLAVAATVIVGVSAQAQTKNHQEKAPTKQMEVRSVQEAKPTSTTTELPVQQVPVHQGEVQEQPAEVQPLQVMPSTQSGEPVKSKTITQKKSSGTMPKKASKGKK